MSEPIRRAISELGFVQPMPVQEEVIPYLLGTMNDVIALAQTGTGKTAAFGIPILQSIDPESQQTQALILSPTRELCLQIADDLRDFSKYLPGIHVEAVYGGASIGPQIRALKHGAQVIVATPGRLIDLMDRGVARLDQVRNVVLDEADEMLNMGFSESIDAILMGVPDDRNTLLFSATMSREIERIAKGYLREYKEIVVGSRNEGAENVNHIYYMVHARDKYLALKRIVDFNPRIYAIIFCRTRTETQEVADHLIRDGYNAESLHGDLSQQQRDLTMQKFRQHLTQLLVATDVAARGLDVDDLTHVINYGLPDDIESYTHRSGRTGRAGKRGTSIAIVHTRDGRKIRAIEKEIGKDFVEGQIPTPQDICTKQLYKVMDQIVKADVDEERIEPFMKEIDRYFEYMDKEDIIKKMVSMQFGRFLAYYANEPELQAVKASSRSGKESEGGKRSRNAAPRGGRESMATPGFSRLFINLGKMDNMYPSELMQFLNRNVKSRFEVGHIDLLPKFAYFEVPEKDAQKVMQALDGIRFHGRELRCNLADDNPKGRKPRTQERTPKGGEHTGSKSRGAKRADGFVPGQGTKAAKGGKAANKTTKEPKQHSKKKEWMKFFE